MKLMDGALGLFVRGMVVRHPLISNAMVGWRVLLLVLVTSLTTELGAAAFFSAPGSRLVLKNLREREFHGKYE